MKLLKMNFPLWQWGNKRIYSLGSYLLKCIDKFNSFNQFDEVNEITINCNLKENDNSNQVINNLDNLKIILEESKNKLMENNPDKLIVYGGDCLVSQQPINYFLSKHLSKMLVLWIDAHPDISDETTIKNSHAMVLKNLMGLNDNELSKFVDVHLNPNQIVYCGLNKDDSLDYEKEFLNNYNFLNLDIKEPETFFYTLNEYIKSNGFEYVYIHLDLDVLNPKIFHSLYFTYNESNVDDYSSIAKGSLTLSNLLEVFEKVKDTGIEILGYSIAEYMPWDAYNLIKFFDKINKLL